MAVSLRASRSRLRRRLRVLLATIAACGLMVTVLAVTASAAPGSARSSWTRTPSMSVSQHCGGVRTLSVSQAASAGVSVKLGHGASYTFGSNHFAATKLTMTEFSLNIERFADRPIIDMTDLKGRYDFAFDVTPEDAMAMMVRAAMASGAALPAAALKLLDASSPAALGDALQQIGLRLEARKAPLDALVVDEVQKTPTAN